MPRYNVEHNGKVACFSTICENFITKFMDKKKYENWRLKEYGKGNYLPLEKSNKMTLEDSVEHMCWFLDDDEILETLIDTGLSKTESLELTKQARIKYNKDQEDEIIND